MEKIDSFHKNYISVTCLKKMRQLPKSNQIKYQLSAAKYLSGRFWPETLNFQEFVKIFRCFVVYIDIDLGAYKLSAPKTGTPVLISLKFRAVIRNFQIFFEKF